MEWGSYIPSGGFRLVPTDDFLATLERNAPQPPSLVARTRCPARTAPAEGHLSVLEEYVPLILEKLRYVLAATQESRA